MPIIDIMRRILNTYGKQLLIGLLIFAFVNNSAFSRSSTDYNSSEILDSLIYESSINKKELSANEYCNIALNYLYNDSFLLALNYAQKTGIKAEIENNFLSMTKQYIIKGQVYIRFGLYLKALDNFSSAEQLGIEHDIKKLIINANYGAGLVYTELEEYDKALEVLYRGEKVAKQGDDLLDRAIIYNAIGNALQGKGEIAESIVYLNKYYDIAVEKDDTLQMIYGLINIGESNRKQNNYIKALEYYRRANKLNEVVHSEQAEAAIYGNIAVIYASLNNNANALLFYHKSINISSKSNGLSSYLQQDLKAIAKIYALQSQYDSSFVYYKKYVAFSDSLSESDYIQKINTLNWSHEIEVKKTQSRIIAEKLARRTIVIISLTIIFVLVVFILIITYSRYKLKSKKMKDNMSVLNLTLDRKNRELVANLIEQTVYSKTHNDIKIILDILDENNDSEYTKQKLLELIPKLSNVERSNGKWDSFKMHFEQVHPNFFIRLNQLSNELTTNDIRFCAYIKLDLSSTEISSYLNISTRAAQATRLRIKKKLKLSQSVNLISFIQSL